MDRYRGLIRAVMISRKENNTGGCCGHVEPFLWNFVYKRTEFITAKLTNVRTPAVENSGSYVRLEE